MTRDDLPEGWGVVSGDDGEEGEERPPYRNGNEVTYSGQRWVVRACEKENTLGETLSGKEPRWYVTIKNSQTKQEVRVPANDVESVLGVVG